MSVIGSDGCNFPRCADHRSLLNSEESIRFLARCPSKQQLVARRNSKIVWINSRNCPYKANNNSETRSFEYYPRSMEMKYTSRRVTELVKEYTRRKTKRPLERR